MPPPGPRAPGPVRVAVAGLWAKWFADAPIALPALRAAAARGGEAWFFGGRPDVHPLQTVAVPAGRGAWRGMPFVYRPMVSSLGAHLRRLGEVDVGLAPLVPKAHNRVRGAGGWLEHALHATPAVLQDLAPYAPAEDGATCLKATTTEEWTEHTLRLVGDAVLRRRIGEAAREEVLVRHTIAARAPAWRAFVAEAAAGVPRETAAA